MQRIRHPVNLARKDAARVGEDDTVRLGWTGTSLLGSIDLNELSPKHRAVAQFVFASPAFASYATAAEVAERLGVAESTVVRFTKEVGFPTYKAFRQSMRHHHLGSLTPLRELRKFDSDQDGTVIGTLKHQVLQDVQNLQSTIETVDAGALEAVAAKIGRARNITVLASGTFSSVATVFVHTLRFLGYSAMAEDRDIPNVTAALVPLDEDDLVIGISFWRVVRSTYDGLRWARSRGIPTVAITDSAYSPLAAVADRRLIVPTESQSFFQSLIAPLSLIYAIVAHLGHQANEQRQRAMLAGVDSFEFFKDTYTQQVDPTSPGGSE
jgi:DNA-binding MurR/RpiR family transcriptional regulator